METQKGFKNEGTTALLADQARALLEGGIGVDADLSIYTFVEILVRAAQNGDLEQRYELILLKNPTILFERGHVFETCLHVCMLRDTALHKKVAKFLVCRKPELVNMAYENDDYRGETPLHMAIINRETDMVKFLLSHGADVQHPAVTGYFFQPSIGKIYFGDSVLDFAVCADDAEIVQLLIEHGAKVNTQDSYGNSPLHLAVIHSLPDMYDLLLRNGADDSVTNHEELTPLLLASRTGNEKMFDFILNRHKDILWKFGPLLCSLYPVGEMSEAIELAVQYRHLSILDHPVALEFLNSKWKAYARRQFLVSCICEMIYFIFLLVAIILQPTDQREDPLSSKNITRYCFEFLVYIGTCLFALTQILYIYKQSLRRLWKSHPIKTFTGWVHCICIWLVVVMRFLSANTAEDILLAIAVVIGWIHLLSYHTGSRLTGAFIVMIQKMLVYDILRFGSIYIALLIGFAQAFFLLYRIPHIGSFESLPSSIMGTFLMSFGEFDYDILVELEHYNLARGIFAHLFFVSFIVIGTILMLNLLIAMMGNTFSTVLENAELEWRWQWTNLVMFLENTTSEWRRERHKPKNIIQWKNSWWMMMEEPCVSWKEASDHAEVPRKEEETPMKLPESDHVLQREEEEEEEELN